MASEILRKLIITVVILLSLLLLWLLALLIARLLWWQHLARRRLASLEVTPPANLSRTSNSTQELFSVIHGLRLSRTRFQKIFKREIVLSFEVVSSKAGGIRYLIKVSDREASSLKKIITSYYPQIKIKEILDETPIDMRVIEFKQTNHFAFPLKSSDYLDVHDPVAYLAGAMTNLDDNEQIRLQLIVSPVVLHEAKTLSRKILRNDDLLYQLQNTPYIPFVGGMLQFVSKLLFAITDLISDTYHGPARQSLNSGSRVREMYEKMQVSNRKKPARSLSIFESELMESMHRKLNQPMHKVAIRIAVQSKDAATFTNRSAAIKSALQTYQVPSYQSIQPKLDLPWLRSLRSHAFRYRLPILNTGHGIVLASSELASLYHFPASVVRPDNVVSSLSRTLAAPVSLKHGNSLDVIIGSNEHHGASTPIGLTALERERHLYIIGGTGNGKTTMLQFSAVQDMQAGKGLAVIDPHGDMAETLLKYVPADRVKDVIYFNPDDLAHPIGLNLLELRPSLSGTELMREKDLITESVISVFRKIFSEEDTGGHRIEYVLRNTVQTALTVEDATLFTVFSLLNDPKYRKKIVAQLDNEDLKNFWKHELGKAGEFQRVKMAAGITAKIGRFLFSASAKQILEQPKSTIDFDDIINSSKILICNFSKGLIGEDTSELFGITVLAKLQLAVLRRARLQLNDRKPFYLYVDEFQNFATPSFVQMLSEARKYKLFMIMAEQSTSQQKDQQMVSIILANAGTVICFRTGNPQDERLLLPLFAPYIDQGEISNLSAFNFYAKLSAVHAQEPVSGQTLLLSDSGSAATARLVIAASQKAYASVRRALSERQPKAMNVQSEHTASLQAVLPDEV